MFIFVISSVIHSILNYKENKKFEKRICCVGHTSLPNNVLENEDVRKREILKKMCNIDTYACQV